jgi:hypothetical protein
MRTNMRTPLRVKCTNQRVESAAVNRAAHPRVRSHRMIGGRTYMIADSKAELGCEA